MVSRWASGREDHDEQFGWHGTWQTATGWEFVDGYRATLSYVAGFGTVAGNNSGATRFASSYGHGIAAGKPKAGRIRGSGRPALMG